jgi:hypothetical protein
MERWTNFMSARTPKFLIENRGPDTEAVKTAFRNVLEISAKSGGSLITLVVPQKGRFRGSIPADVLGDKLAGALVKGDAKLDATTSMRLESGSTFRPLASYDIVMGLHIGLAEQYRIDTSDTKTIVFVPWLEDEGKEWQGTWSPTVWGQDSWKTPAFQVPSDFDAALLKLTDSINLGTGISHPSDRDRARSTLSSALANGYAPRKNDLLRWALQHNWTFSGAEALEKLGVSLTKRS